MMFVFCAKEGEGWYSIPPSAPERRVCERGEEQDGDKGELHPLRRPPARRCREGKKKQASPSQVGVR